MGELRTDLALCPLQHLKALWLPAWSWVHGARAKGDGGGRCGGGAGMKRKGQEEEEEEEAVTTPRRVERSAPSPPSSASLSLSPH